MTAQTTIELAEAYAALADKHRQAAMEHGPHSSMRVLHSVQAEMAESHAIAWHQRADRQFQPAIQETSHD